MPSPNAEDPEADPYLAALRATTPASGMSRSQLQILRRRIAYAAARVALETAQQARWRAVLGREVTRAPSISRWCPGGGTDSEWRAILAFTLDAVAVIA